MKLFMLLGMITLSLAACDVEVSGSGGADPGGQSGLEVEILKISTDSDLLPNTTELSGDGDLPTGTEPVVKRFTIESSSTQSLRGNGGSNFSLGCSTDPEFVLELVRFDLDGTELSRSPIFYDSFIVEQGELAEVQVTISNISPDCMSISHTFYVMQD